MRLHTGQRAAESARSLGAAAFTLGTDIVFGAREQRATEVDGGRLLAHELTHVVQQSGSPVPVLQRALKQEEKGPTGLAAIATQVISSFDGSIQQILNECGFYGVSDRSHIAYILASAHWESRMGKTMIEGASGDAYENRKELCNTSPRDGPRYKGRGFVQLTGRCNYTKYTDILSVTREQVDLVNNPEKAADPGIAAMILVHGMKTGTYTGRSLSNFGADPNYDFVGARAIVNDQDKAKEIADIARRYRTAIGEPAKGGQQT